MKTAELRQLLPKGDLYEIKSDGKYIFIIAEEDFHQGLCKAGVDGLIIVARQPKAIRIFEIQNEEQKPVAKAG